MGRLSILFEVKVNERGVSLLVKNIILIGFMGSGKSSVGKRLAKALHWTFIDTDSAIEELTGMTVAEIFRKHGEIRFRSEEKALVKRLRDVQYSVISTGGGTVLDPENWDSLAQTGIIVALDATFEVIWARIGNRNDRPLIRAGREEAERLWQARQPFYNRADWVIDTTQIGVDEVVSEVLRKLKGRLESEERWEDESED